MGCGASAHRATPRGPDNLINVSELRPEGKAAVSIRGTENRAITVAQLDAVVNYLDNHCKRQRWTSSNPSTPKLRLNPNTINLYDVVHWVVKPATKNDCCSYVELIATGEQVPQWFVSHWWGEPVKRFVACLRGHRLDRRLEESCAYWVCAYANNQWQAGEEVGDDPANSSFRRAIDKAVGTVTVLDDTATTYTRIWCTYEIFVSLTTDRGESKYLYDVFYTATADLEYVGITDGYAAVDLEVEMFSSRADRKLRREAQFPFKMLSKGLRSEVDKALASVEKDRIHILNAIAHSSDLDAVPPSRHQNYDRVNQRLRGRFALKMFHPLIRGGCARDLAELVASGMSTSGEEEIDVDLSFAKDLPLAFSILKSSLPNPLTRFSVVCQLAEAGCGAGVGIAEAIQRAHGLTQLTIDLMMSKVGADVGAALGKAIGGLHRLEALTVTLVDTGVGDEGAAALGEAVGGLRHLEKLDLTLSHNDLGAAGFTALISALRQLPALARLFLRLGRCGLDDGVAEGLADALRVMPAAKIVWIELGGNRLTEKCQAELAKLRTELRERPAQPVDINLDL